MKKILIILISSALIALCGCAEKRNTVSTNGSSSMERVIGALGEAFQNENKDINFTFDPTGSSAGIVAVMEKRCDIGLSSRSLTEDEATELNADILALDGIAVIVNRDNPISDLTTEQIFEVYTKKIKNWSELGGESLEIVLIGREAGSGTRDGFESIINAENKCKYRQQLTSTGDVITAVSSNPAAIGYASMASVGNKVKILTVDGVEPRESTVKDGSYKMSRPFVLVTRKNESLNEVTQKFIDFAFSENAREIITAAGVIPTL